MQESYKMVTVAQHKHSGRLVGMVLIWCVANEIQVMEVAVLPEHQGQSIGSRMFSKALEISIK